MIGQDVFMQRGDVVAVEMDFWSHVGGEERFEYVVDFIEYPRMVDDVDCVGVDGEARLEKKIL